jgi:hypothetical protein
MPQKLQRDPWSQDLQKANRVLGTLGCETEGSEGRQSFVRRHIDVQFCWCYWCLVDEHDVGRCIIKSIVESHGRISATFVLANFHRLCQMLYG